MASQYYNGLHGLRNAGFPAEYTLEQMDEYIKCMDDPVYFINNFCKIVSLDRGEIPFSLYDYQVKFVRAMHENRKVISMQPRQQGKTQTVAAYILWYSLFSTNETGDKKPVTVAILANKGAASREILARYKFMYQNLPYWMQSGVITWNKGDIELENKSIVFTGATSADGIRGRSVNLLYVDEVAIVQNTVADAFFTSTYPTISSGETTKIILTSTPLGYNHFWKFWQEAIEGRNGFVPIQIHYHEHPGRGEKWASEQRAILGELKFNQEVMCNFLGSSLTLISPDVIGRMAGIQKIYSKDGLDIYEPSLKKDYLDFDNKKVDKDHVYVIVVDTSKGLGGDYSAFIVFDVSTVPYKMVAKYRNNTIVPMLFPSIIYKIARDYNDAYVLFELNSSEQVPHIMYYELEYENIFFISQGKRGQEISAGFGGGGSTRLGVNTDKKVKRIGCANAKSLVEEGKILITDIDTIAELSTFIQVKDSYAADDGYHDDLAMCLVLFGWMTTQPYFKDLINVDLRMLMYKSRMDAIDAETLPIGHFWTGSEEQKEEMFNF
jgi:hypothetical protein